MKQWNILSPVCFPANKICIKEKKNKDGDQLFRLFLGVDIDLTAQGDKVIDYLYLEKTLVNHAELYIIRLSKHHQS